MATWRHKRNDTYPDLTVTLKDSAGSAVDVSGATVKFIMRAVAESVPKVNAAMSFVTDGSNGQVKYEWLAADTDEAGMYWAEYQVTYAGGDIQTFPTVGWDRVLIYGDLETV